MKTFIYISIILLSGFSFAQSGKLKGKISDGSAGLPSVNIIIRDTNFGTASKLDGTYEISGIPAGSYEARFSLIGFDSKTFDIEIEANKVTELNVEL
ncbi:MAG: carboxypeptidase-like regulatory domain-containing protein, partial [Ignavibacteriales bacterium]